MPPKTSFCHLVCHMSHPWLFLSRAFLHEHFLFLACLSYHTRRNTQYIPPHLQDHSVDKFAPSRITLPLRPAEWAENPRTKQLPTGSMQFSTNILVCLCKSDKNNHDSHVSVGSQRTSGKDECFQTDGNSWEKHSYVRGVLVVELESNDRGPSLSRSRRNRKKPLLECATDEQEPAGGPRRGQLQKTNIRESHEGDSWSQ